MMFSKEPNEPWDSRTPTPTSTPNYSFVGSVLAKCNRVKKGLKVVGRAAPAVQVTQVWAPAHMESSRQQESYQPVILAQAYGDDRTFTTRM